MQREGEHLPEGQSAHALSVRHGHPEWLVTRWLEELGPEQAEALLQALELSGSGDAPLAEQLTTYPVKGALDPVIPTDPLLYRFYEILQVYGLPLKDVIQEKFGDGIMSAIDFSLTVNRQEDPKGDRVVVTMNGKFLPYRTW